MYVEQLESTDVLGRVAAGSLKSLSVQKVAVKADAAKIDLVARFADSTSASGRMSLVRSGGKWYLFSLTGMRSGDKAGDSGSVAGFTEEEPERSVEDEASSIGIRTFDSGVIATLVSQQAARQETIKQVLAGKYDTLAFDAPKNGVGTVTIPVRLSGSNAEPLETDVILITKMIDGKSRTFMTKFGE
jgi:hypothetical protein